MCWQVYAQIHQPVVIGAMTGGDLAFEWFDRAITARDAIASHLPSMPLYDGLRPDPRFRKLLARMNLA